MKKTVLGLLALLSLLSFGQSMAQTPPVATPAPDSVADFLATLADKPAQTLSDLAPAPLFMTGCGYNPPCAPDELCCFMCGNPPAEDPDICLACVTPIRGRCPMVV